MNMKDGSNKNGHPGRFWQFLLERCLPVDTRDEVLRDVTKRYLLEVEKKEGRREAKARYIAESLAALFGFMGAFLQKLFVAIVVNILFH